MYILNKELNYLMRKLLYYYHDAEISVIRLVERSAFESLILYVTSEKQRL